VVETCVVSILLYILGISSCILKWFA